MGQFLYQVWQRWKIPSVIDADALNWVSKGLLPPHAPCVFTPHPGEIARLISKSRDEVQKNREPSLREAVGKYGQVCLLKGAQTLVGAPDGTVQKNPTGNAGMATGGMGDVLAGMIGTLLAQGLSPFDAAACAVYWHGLAGDKCAEEIGAIGYTASEVAAKLPSVRV